MKSLRISFLIGSLLFGSSPSIKARSYDPIEYVYMAVCVISIAAIIIECKMFYDVNTEIMKYNEILFNKAVLDIAAQN